MAMVYVVLFLFGTTVGSFLNVVVYRLGTGERIGKARSRCFSCGTTLQWYELIPLVSFLLQKGKCRYCGSKISIQYPIVEFVTGVVFLLVFNRLETDVSRISYLVFDVHWIMLLLALFIFSLLIAISVYDFRHKIIPNQLVYLFIGTSLFMNILDVFVQDTKYEIRDTIFLYILAGFATFAFFASLWFFSKGKWMGFGDAKLALGIGFLLGPALTFIAVVLSFWIGTLIAVPLAYATGRGFKTQVPFGPFLAVGALTSWLYGDAILHAYFSLL